MTLYNNSLRKYTLGLLSLFNDLEIQYLNSDSTTTTKKIPIKFSSREKAKMFDEHTTKQLLSGNYNILPRANISLSTMVKIAERNTNKFNKINIVDDGDVKSFTYNSVAYEYTYELTIQCRGMNEASMIIEQIAPRFNPNYTLRINEVPNQAEPTSVPIQLLDISIEQEEYSEISSNIVTIGVGLSMKGQMYPPLKTLEKIKNIDLFVNNWYHSDLNEFNRAALFEYDIVDHISQPPVKTDLVSVDGTFGNITPEVIDIISVDSVEVGNDIILEAQFVDADNKFEELTFTWNKSGSVNIAPNDNYCTVTGVSTEIVDISVSITDVHGNVSNTFIKQITVI